MPAQHFKQARVWELQQGKLRIICISAVAQVSHSVRLCASVRGPPVQLAGSVDTVCLGVYARLQGAPVNLLNLQVRSVHKSHKKWLPELTEPLLDG
jgi:hypothetical protein